MLFFRAFVKERKKLEAWKRMILGSWNYVECLFCCVGLGERALKDGFHQKRGGKASWARFF